MSCRRVGGALRSDEREVQRLVVRRQGSQALGHLAGELGQFGTGCQLEGVALEHGGEAFDCLAVGRGTARRR